MLLIYIILSNIIEYLFKPEKDEKEGFEIVPILPDMESDLPYVPLDIGNFLSDFFYGMGMAFLDGKDYSAPDQLLRATRESCSNMPFIQNLPYDLKCRKDIQTCMLEKGLTREIIESSFSKIANGAGYATSTIIDDVHERFWTCMKPLIKEIYDEAFKKSNIHMDIKYPVIHFRCSDTPYMKSANYGFQRYQFFKESLKRIEEETGKKYDKVILCFCNAHFAKEKESKTCDVYADSLVKYLEELGYEVIVKCGNNLGDFATIYFAPAVISTSSSFSFMAGFFSGGVFITEGHKQEKPETDKSEPDNKDQPNVYMCMNCGPWLSHKYMLNHSEVPDYFDTEYVIKKLKE